MLCEAGTLAALVSADSSCGWEEKVSGAKISYKEAKKTVKGLGGLRARVRLRKTGGNLDACMILHAT